MKRDGLAGDFDASRFGPIDAKEHAAELGSSRAHEAGETDDFTGANVEADVSNPATREVCYTQQGVAGGNRRAAVHGIDGATDHVLNELFAGEAGERAGEDSSTITEDGDAVTERAQFFEAMGDVNDADAAVTQLADNAKDLASFGFGERGGGLVEDQQAGALRDGTADFDELPAGGTEVFDAGFGIEMEFIAGDERGGAFDDDAAAHPSGFGGDLAPEKNIFGNSKMRGKQGLLVDHGDTLLSGFGRIFEIDRLPAPEHFPGIAAVHTGDHAHESGFAGAVFSHEQVHFPLRDFQVRIAERTNAAEAFLDCAERE